MAPDLLDWILPEPRPITIGRGVYTALPLRVRDLLALGKGAREARREAFAPFRALLALEPEEALRARWCREALAAIEAAEAPSAGDAWAAELVARVLRRSAPLPSGLHQRIPPEDWPELLAIAQGLDPVDECYRAIDPPPLGGGRSWAKLYCGLAESYHLSPDQFGDLMLPQLRVLATRGTSEPGSPWGEDEDEDRAILRHRHRVLWEDKD